MSIWKPTVKFNVGVVVNVSLIDFSSDTDTDGLEFFLRVVYTQKSDEILLGLLLRASETQRNRETTLLILSLYQSKIF